MWRSIVALLSGALMNIQGMFNTEVTRQTSIWVSAEFVQLTAFFTCVIVWPITGRNEVGGLFQVQPWYMLTGGVVGALITCTVIKSVGTLEPAKSALIIVITQIIVAYGAEMFGLFGVNKIGLEWKKALGTLMAIVGIVIFRWGWRLFEEVV